MDGGAMEMDGYGAQYSGTVCCYCGRPVWDSASRRDSFIFLETKEDAEEYNKVGRDYAIGHYHEECYKWQEEDN